jgi:hypothetical protein
VPPGLTGIVAVAAGPQHSLALTSSGRVVGWGSKYLGQSEAPVGLSNVVAITAGNFRSLALKMDGTLAAWGLDGNFVPVDLDNVVAIASSFDHRLALRADGTVVGWGMSQFGEANVPAELNAVVAIATGYEFSLALLGEGAPRFSPAVTNRSVALGASANLYATATGAWPITYQWQFNGVDLPDQTKPMLLVPNAQIENAGQYTLIASNALGVTRQEFHITVPPLEIIAPPVSRSAWL